MKRTQKIKWLIAYLVLVIILELLVVFFIPINSNIERMLLDKFQIVSTEDNLLVHFISVGQGDAIALNLPNGKVVLIDTGPKNKNVTYTNYLDRVVINSQQDKSIDYLILTHADVDHIGGTIRALNRYDIDKIFLPKVASSSKYYEELMFVLGESYHYDWIDSEDSIDVGQCRIKVFDTEIEADTNNSSAVIRLEYLNKSFLFTGDIEGKREIELIDKFGDGLKSDVLKVSHHGGSSSTSEKFLEVVQPKYSVISVGDNNYGHPTNEVLAKLNSIDSTILRTDIEGNILFVLGEDIDLDYLNGDYMVIGISLDIRYYCAIGAIVLLINSILLILRKKRKR